MGVSVADPTRRVKQPRAGMLCAIGSSDDVIGSVAD